MGLSSRTRRRLRELDAACALLRHVTEVRAEAFLEELAVGSKVHAPKTEAQGQWAKAQCQGYKAQGQRVEVQGQKDEVQDQKGEEQRHEDEA